jgi:hypothetical protein
MEESDMLMLYDLLRRIADAGERCADAQEKIANQLAEWSIVSNPATGAQSLDVSMRGVVEMEEVEHAPPSEGKIVTEVGDYPFPSKVR